MNKLVYDRVIKGRWHNVKLWDSQETLDRYNAGDKTAQPIWVPDFLNGITNVGVHYLLEVGFRDGVAPNPAQIATWYAGLIDNASFTAVAAGDTSASHAGWVEADEYDETGPIT